MKVENLIPEIQSMQQDFKELKRSFNILTRVVDSLCERQQRLEMEDIKSSREDKKAQEFLLKQTDHS